MQKQFKLKMASFIFAALFFSGCSLSDTAKKTEINLDNEKATKATIENDTDNDVASDAQQSQISNLPETEAPAEAPSKTVAETSVSKAIDTSAESASTSSQKFKIIDRLIGWGFTKANSRTIDTIIIHSSYNAVGSDEHDLDDIINKEYKPSGVSPHYIIARDGKVYRLVADQNIAYHAGVSKMPDGRTNVNNFSIGIEVVETTSESPSSAQYASLKSLISYLKDKYEIKHVLGHSDIAPDRKDDPWNFSWSKIGGKEK